MVGFMEGGHCSRGILKRWLLRSGCSLSSPSLISGPALNEACNQAAHGTVLAVCELPAMAQGRDLVARRLKSQLGAVESASGESDGPPVCDQVQPSVGRLLENRRPLKTEIRDYTPLA